MGRKCIAYFERRKQQEKKDKVYLKIDKTKVAYDESEIDYINDH